MASTIKTLPSAATQPARAQTQASKELKSARYDSAAADKSLNDYENHIIRQARAHRAARAGAVRATGADFRSVLSEVFQAKH